MKDNLLLWSHLKKLTP